MVYLKYAMHSKNNIDYTRALIDLIDLNYVAYISCGSQVIIT
jgi:hypothetical protein